MSSKPVYAEISLSKKPKRLKNTDNVCAPVMQASDIIKASLIENPKVHPLVEKAVSDTDLKAGEALTDLYLKGIDETQLTKLLSIACLGIKRKLVPTRWGITAVDDTLGRALIKEVKDYKDADCSLFYGSYLGNHYFILLFSEPWSFELFEAYLPNTLLNPNPEIRFCHDHELYNGRTGYAEQCAGGYYACRLAVLEGLKKIKRQGSVLVLRLISQEYNMPLGVWVCREAARRAMNEKHIVFQDKEKILKHVKNYCLQLFGIDVSDVLKQSILLKQKSLFDYQTA
ncbi:hypothetical protein HZB88_04180 [archaeon]|nr:hypothetical protein [archaeon]